MFNIEQFLNKKNGKYAWYVVATNEIIINNIKANPKFNYAIYLQFMNSKSPLYLSDVVFLGTV